jgi:hypothetical protein
VCVRRDLAVPRRVPAVTDLDPELVAWTAQQVIRQHTEPSSEDRATGRCAQCPDDGAAECRLLRWARVMLPDVGGGAPSCQRT